MENEHLSSDLEPINRIQRSDSFDNSQLGRQGCGETALPYILPPQTSEKMTADPSPQLQTTRGGKQSNPE